MGTIKYFLIFSVMLGTISCFNQKKASNQEEIFKGVVEKKPFVNKAGVEKGEDYYFKIKDKSYLISLSRSKIKIEELEAIVGKEIEVEAALDYGNEVAPVNEDGVEIQPQSRMLDYIVIFKLR